MMEKPLESLVEITKAINSVLETGKLLETIMDSAITALGVERGILFLKSPDGTLQPRVARNVERETLTSAEEISRSIISEVAGSGKYFLSSNLQGDPNVMSRPSVKAFKILSVLCVPLASGEEIIGTIYLDSRKLTKVFEESDVKFLQTFANLAAIAIGNVRVYEATKSEARYWKEEAAQRHGFETIIAGGEAMAACIGRAKSVAASNVSVLLTGESGTGKELFARAIHYNSPRREKKFVPINCSALPEQILESELFGSKKGAFTGAVSDARGLFEEADGGTVFLDEIADMQPALQAKLLRVLQEGEVRRVGDTQYRHVDVRILAATNKDIQSEMRAGRFREDLYYRICGLAIPIPPLRDRREDILPLARHFLKNFCAEQSLNQKSFAPAAAALLREYRFPGNVRELQNIVATAALLAGTNEEITGVDLPDGGVDAPGEEFSDAMRLHIIKTLEKTGWNQTKAADLLGLNRTTLQAKMKRLGIGPKPR